MSFSNTYVFGFAAGVCLICSLALATTSQALKEQQQTNIRRDFQKNILAALQLPEGGGELWGEDIDKLYAERVKIIVVDDAGVLQEGKSIADVEAAEEAAETSGAKVSLHAVYQRVDGAGVGAYAIPLEGKGLWGPISGFLAIGPDGATIIGSTFFAPKETPGLGYEITQTPFREQWKGKKVFDGQGAKPVRVVKGTAAQLCPDNLEFCVDGISGSTLTCNGVDAMVKEAVATYDPYLSKIRSGGV